ncbi:hypothetical protein EI555_010937 [Monodon monoceros]|uniref:Uncharacterized protein n=1 Tax=Monodon monoceros TaxID=40151 RepID=A0A4U1F5G9_MONMO|nr:hypothetical protein EI555_010937 [Monodon monoceros]
MQSRDLSYRIALLPGCEDALHCGNVFPGSRVGWEQLDAEIKPWWTVPENFTFPLEFYIEEGQGKLMFGEWSQPIPRPSRPRTGPPGPPRRPPGPDLARIIEVQSQTLIRLEARFTATGLTRVLVVRPAESRQRLFLRIWRLGSWDPQSRARGGRPQRT